MRSTNYFSKSILRGSVTAGEFIFVYRCQYSLGTGSEAGEKEKNNGQRSEPRGSLRKGKSGAALFPSQGHRPARFFRRYFSYLTPFFFPFSPITEPYQANPSYAMKLQKLPLSHKITASCLQNIISIVTNNRNEL